MHLVEHLADLAGQRDRETLSRAFTGLLDDLVKPAGVAAWRPVADARSPLWEVLAERGAAPDEPVVRPLLMAAMASGQVHALGPTDGPVLALPLVAESDTACVVTLALAQAVSAEQQRTMQCVQRFYGHLRGLMDENERDALTRLLNRKSFDETFLRLALAADHTPGEGDRRGRTGETAWLGVVDIDHFKRVNDVHGHLIGDEVLILTARLMQQVFRADDRLYRFGGEEFVVLLRARDALGAEQAFERLRSTVERQPFPQVGQLTISIGFTEVRACDTPSAAFSRADKAVYQGKADGRNRAISYETMTGQTERDEAGTIEFF